MVFDFVLQHLYMAGLGILGMTAIGNVSMYEIARKNDDKNYDDKIIVYLDFRTYGKISKCPYCDSGTARIGTHCRSENEIN